MIPPVTNDFIALFKDTAVCSAILIVELTRMYYELTTSTATGGRTGVHRGRAVPADELPDGAPGPVPGDAHGHARGRAPPMIRVTNVVKYHGTAPHPGRAELEFRKGEVAALVGPSGGGKSTLLRCVNGLEPFQEGQVAVGDSLKLAGGRRRRRRPTLLATAPRGRDGVPAVQPVPAHDGVAERHGRAGVRTREAAGGGRGDREATARPRRARREVRREAGATFRRAAAACCDRPGACG